MCTLTKLLVVLSASLVLGCKPTPPPAPPLRLTLGITSEPSSLCPLFADNNATSEVQGLLFRDLVRVTPDGRAGDLAARLPTLGDGAVVDQDGRFVVEWFLRDDAFWSDGTPVTARDVVAGFKVARDPAQATTGGRDLANLIDDVIAVDDHHARVIWKAPQPSFADPRVHRVLPAHRVLNADGSVNAFATNGFCKAPVSDGPFRVVEWNSGSHLLLARNASFVPRPALDEVVVRFIPATDGLASALLAGDIDATFPAGGLNPAEAARVVAQARAPALTSRSAAGNVWVHLDFRLDDPWLSDLRLRQALGLAVDRAGLAAIAGGADVDDSYLPPQHWAHAAVPPLAFDRARAEQLLDDAGWKRPAPGAIRQNAKGEVLRLELAAASGQRDTEKLLQLMQGMWRDAGVDVALDLKPVKVFFGENAKKRKLKHLWFYTWTLDESATGLNLWRSDRIPSEQNGFSGQNLPGWKNDEVTRLLQETDATVDTAVRKEKLARVQQLFAAELPALSFWFRQSVVVVAAGVSGPAPTGTLTPMAWNAATWTKAN